MINPFTKHKRNAKDMAWLVRAAYETAWRNAGATDDWRDSWKKSNPRATLVSMGYIDERDGYR